MKKLLLFCLFITGLLTACSTDNPAYPQRLAQNIRHLSSASVLSVYALDNYPAAQPGEIITQSAQFKTIYDLYEDGENKILIPHNTNISGIYRNNGTTCTVTWKTLYANNDQTQDKSNAVPISRDISVPSNCNPAKGIKYGDRITINFNDRSN